MKFEEVCLIDGLLTEAVKNNDLTTFKSILSQLPDSFLEDMSSEYFDADYDLLIEIAHNKKEEFMRALLDRFPAFSVDCLTSLFIFDGPEDIDTGVTDYKFTIMALDSMWSLITPQQKSKIRKYFELEKFSSSPCISAFSKHVLSLMN